MQVGTIDYTGLLGALREGLQQELAYHGAMIPLAEPSLMDLIPAGHPLHGMSTLDEARAFVNSTMLLDIDKQRTNAVFGEGSSTADIVVIGEAPGADEDRDGKPFVGRAGQLLTKILAAIRLTRDEVYITNILKSRPPQNRTPTAKETAAHLPILHFQLAQLRPLVILCVGKTAAAALLQCKGTLGGMRGKVHDFHGIPLIATYHPAALLRNPAWKRPTWEDVQMLRKVYDQRASQ